MPRCGWMGVIMIALIAGANDKTGKEMQAALLEKKWQIYTAESQLQPGIEGIDLLILNIDDKPIDDRRCITDSLNYEEMQKTYDTITLKTLRLVACYLPFLEKGKLKRIALVNSIESSNNITNAIDGFAYSMSKAALNMMMSILMNRYRPEGYTFRVFCLDGCIENEGEYAVQYFLHDRSYEPDDLKHSDENRLVMRNALEREYPW